MLHPKCARQNIGETILHFLQTKTLLSATALWKKVNILYEVVAESVKTRLEKWLQ